jgi:glucokinase
MTQKLALGIDIGGTGIEYGVVDQEGNVVYETQISTRHVTSAEILRDILLQDSEIIARFSELFGIGIGAPNGNFYNGTIEFAPNLPWKGIVPLKEIFEKSFGIPTIVTNDANAAALGEKLFGNAKDLDDFVTITLGTGVGSGIISSGKLIYGHDGFAGEYGHIRVIPNGRLCGCGRKGCLETYASSTGVVRSVKELDSETKNNSILLKIPNISAKDVFEYADKGDSFANEIVEFTAKILGNALADFTCFSSPKAYVLFGGIAQSGDCFSDLVHKYMNENLLVIYKNKIEIRTSSLHIVNAAVLGAASLIFTDRIV